MHFQLLHKPRCFRSGIRTMRVNSRRPREPQYLNISRATNHIFVVGLQPSGLLPVWRVSSRDTTLRGATDHRRAGPKQKQRIIGHVRIQYNKECALKWQVPKGKIFVFPKFQGNRSIISGDMTRDVNCVECKFGLRPVFFCGRVHTC